MTIDLQTLADLALTAIGALTIAIFWANYLSSPHHYRPLYRVGSLMIIAGVVAGAAVGSGLLPAHIQHWRLVEWGLLLVAISVWRARRRGLIEWRPRDDD